MLNTLQRHEIARRFLLWPKRDIGVDVLCFSRSDDTEIHVKPFSDYLATLDHRRHDDDIELAVRDFFKACPRWIDWWEALLPDFRCFFDFFDREPRVGQGNFTRWREVSAEIDPDALVVLAMALRGQEMDAGGLSSWGAFVRGGSEDLDRVLRKGVSETHVHFAACNAVAVLWQRVMMQSLPGVRLEALDRYAPRTLDPKESRLSDEEIAKRMREMESIRLARDEWLPRLLSKVSIPAQHMSNEDKNTSPLWSYLSLERCLLAGAWRAALDGDKEIANDLDKYLVVKSIFLHNHQQIGNTNPGLPRFRRYLDAGRPEESSWSFSPKMKEHYHGAQLDLAAESPYLRTLELRIAPFKSIREYQDFFRVIDRLEERESWKRHRNNVRLSFIVHFIRKARNLAPILGQGPCPEQRKALDRQSAILHVFRLHEKAYARHITGIDVANYERYAQPHCFLAAFQLLRGMDVSAERLEAAGFHHWKRLRESERHLHPPHLPRLGFTYHVGEDFYHPLDGMRYMSDLMEAGSFKPGDRFGHGLAPGIDLGKFGEERGKSVPIPSGVLLDNGAWLLQQMTDHGGHPSSRLAELQTLVADISSRIYGKPVSLPDLMRLQRTRYFLGGIENLNKHEVPQSVVELWQQELSDSSAQEKRRKLAEEEWQTAFLKFSLEMTEVQSQLLRRLAQSGIAVEFNPASNLATGAIRQMKDHPIFRYIDVQGDRLTATLSTDDPGVFATRIENEFEMILEAMLANGYQRNQALGILEKLREVGCELAF